MDYLLNFIDNWLGAASNNTGKPELFELKDPVKDNKRIKPKSHLFSFRRILLHNESVLILCGLWSCEVRQHTETSSCRSSMTIAFYSLFLPSVKQLSLFEHREELRIYDRLFCLLSWSLYKSWSIETSRASAIFWTTSIEGTLCPLSYPENWTGFVRVITEIIRLHGPTWTILT